MCKYKINSYNLLAKVDFDCTEDHLALTYIMKSKTELASARIKRLLEVLSAYSFNLYNMKEKEMTLNDFLSRIKEDKLKLHEIIHISFALQEVLQEKYYIQTRSGAQKEDITVGKIHAHYKSLIPHLKLEKADKILSQLPSITASPNQPQMPTNVYIRRGVGRSAFKRKVPGTNPLVKPRVFSQSPQIQSPTLLSQTLQIPNNQRVIHPTYMERKQIVLSLSHRPTVQPSSDVSFREVTKQDKYYSPQHTSQIYHSPKPQNFPERQILDPPQTVSQQPEIDHPENIDLEFP